MGPSVVTYWSASLAEQLGAEEHVPQSVVELFDSRDSELRSLVGCPVVHWERKDHDKVDYIVSWVEGSHCLIRCQSVE
jgi:hypothetical protein